MTKVDVRLQRARRRLGGARVLAIKLRVEPCPTFCILKTSSTPRGCQPCLRGSRLSSRVPSALSLSVSRLGGTHSRRGQSGLRERVTRRRRLRRGGCVRSDDGTTTALLRRPGKEGPAPVPRGTGGRPPSPGLSSDCGRQPRESRAARPLLLSNDQRPGKVRSPIPRAFTRIMWVNEKSSAQFVYVRLRVWLGWPQASPREPLRCHISSLVIVET